jgi:acetate kinase
MSVKNIEDLLYKNSGLLGYSGLSSDMRTLLSSSDPQAQEAVELYCYKAAREICALMPGVDVLDALIFTGGIAENSVLIRSKIISYLEILGAKIDHKKNEDGEVFLHSDESKITIMVLPTDEEFMMAQHVKKLLS